MGQARCSAATRCSRAAAGACSRNAGADVRVARSCARCPTTPRSTAGTSTRSRTSDSRRASSRATPSSPRARAATAPCERPASRPCRARCARRRPPIRSCAAPSPRWSNRSTNTWVRAFPILCAYSRRYASGKTAREKAPAPGGPGAPGLRDAACARARPGAGRRAGVAVVQPVPAPPAPPAPRRKPAIATPKPFDAADRGGAARRRRHRPRARAERPVVAHPQRVRDSRPHGAAGQAENHAVRRAPEYLQRILARSKLYLYHIVEEIEKRGLPTELALLPMVESAFNPMAYSRAHASGLWQFIPGTGKRFELEQNSWYDGRRDIVDSTSAALDYLTKLYEMHGDWHLALASYNWGENAVKKAVARNKAQRRPTTRACACPRRRGTTSRSCRRWRTSSPTRRRTASTLTRSRTSRTSPSSATPRTSTCTSPRGSPRCRSRTSSRSTPASAGR